MARELQVRLEINQSWGSVTNRVISAGGTRSWVRDEISCGDLVR
jgi:hypothetical protein